MWHCLNEKKIFIYIYIYLEDSAKRKGANRNRKIHDFQYLCDFKIKEETKKLALTNETNGLN